MKENGGMHYAVGESLSIYLGRYWIFTDSHVPSLSSVSRMLRCK
jgi:hypothetical protein